MDFWGVPRAKNETILSSFQYFFVCLIIGFTIRLIYKADTSKLPVNVSFCCQWALVDTIVAFVSKLYLYLSMMIKMDGEILVNVATLSLCQWRKIDDQKQLETYRYNLWVRLKTFFLKAKIGVLDVLLKGLSS